MSGFITGIINRIVGRHLPDTTERAEKELHESRAKLNERIQTLLEETIKITRGKTNGSLHG